MCKYLQSAKEGQQRGGENKNKKARQILASPASGYTSSTSSNSKRPVAGYSAGGRGEREDGVNDQSDGKEISGGEGARDAREREAEDTRRRLRQRVVALNYKNVRLKMCVFVFVFVFVCVCERERERE